eukprot:m.121569 g.121569  ORF g.121569 m.121569 type:complete len:977 (+) comp37756_c0_seq1:16-2946(+)
MKSETARCCAILAWIVILYITGMLFFTKGFFLSKTALENKASCAKKPESKSPDTNIASSSRNCGEIDSQRYEKLVVLVVDALRFDYTLYDEEIDKKSVPFYRNKLPVLKELLGHPDVGSSHLYRLVSDPPTLTVQGLKGLTTGTLPSYINAGANFAASEVVEDSWIYQVTQRGLNVTFLGDDTWMGLFGGLFNRKLPVTSFTIDDYLTVDDKITENLADELRRPDWTVLIAHFLGVDHCGHKEGISSKEMAHQLAIIDGIIRNVISLIDNTTLFVLLGDHGMTEDGMHGSDSVAEIESALFFYGKQTAGNSPKVDKQDGIKIKTVNQIDFVPTISLLLGLPVPFSNLGFIIPELFAGEEKDPYSSLLRAARFNAQQLDTYLTVYFKSSLYGNLLPADYNRLKKQFQRIEDRLLTSSSTNSTAGNAAEFYNDYVEYIKEVQRVCRGLWTRDFKAIFAGLLLLLVACGVNFCLFWNGSACLFDGSIYYCVLGGIIGVFSSLPVCFLLGFSLVESFVFGVICGSALGFIFSVLRSKGLHFKDVTLNGFFGTAMLLIQCIILYSDSYIHNEDAVVDYVVKTTLVVYVLLNIMPNVRIESVNCKVALFLAIGVLFVSRLASNFHACRSTLLNPCRESTDGQLSDISRLVLSCVCLGMAPCVVFLYQKSWSSSLSRLWRYICFCGLSVMSISVCLFWTMKLLPSEEFLELPDWQVVFLPRLVDFLTAFFFMSTLLQRPSGPFPRRMENSFKPTGVLLAPLLGAAWIFLTMMQSTRLAPATSLMAFQTLLIYGVIAIACKMSQQLAVQVAWVEVVLWCACSWQYFYFTSHHTALSSLRIEAAFVGLRGAVTPGLKMAAATLLVFVNTYASQIWFTLSLPLMQLCRKANYLVVADGSTLQNARPSFTDMAVSYMLCCGFKMTNVCLAVTWFLDHPAGMGTFTPRLVFEFGSFICISVVLLVSSSLASFIHHRTAVIPKTTKTLQ